MTPPEPEWIRLIGADELPPGQSRFLAVSGRELAIFHLADTGRFAVIDNSCPHAGGNLSAGTVADGVVTCPWHQWEFDLSTGACTTSERVCVRRYPVRVEDGVVYARLKG
jgi:NAD(P)H-dependent nitrite reductase small subunit